ncbi:HotDog domain-containing protein [Xylariales sp. PMI_506]|nr:HotDog domain-containing protein [Xylariales sp. PMI_506]
MGATLASSVLIKNHDTDSFMSEVEDLLQAIATSHPATIEFKRDSDITCRRSVLVFDAEDIPYNLTETTLMGKDRIVCRPFVFANPAVGSLLAFYHLGPRLAGHRRMVHGGILGVLLDECMGAACFPRFAGRVGVTAQLDMSFKSPLAVGTEILVRATTAEVSGRKAWVHATVENARDGTILVQAKALFIEPKWAAEMVQAV